MRDEEKTKEQLSAELAALRGRAQRETDLFHRLAEASGRGVGMADLQGIVTYVNPTMCRMLGESDPADVVGKHFSVWCPEQYRRQVAEDVLPTVLAHGQWNGESAILTRQGQVIPTLENAYLINDDAGQPLRLALAVADLSERKRAEETLQRSQATLDAFFGASTAILNIFDDEFRYLKSDSLTPTYFGLDSQSIVGQSLKDLAPPFIAEFGPMIRRVIETGEPVHNVEVKSPVPGRPGEIVYWRASYFALPLPDGRRGYGVVGVEINDLKQAEEAMRRSEEKYRGLIEASPDAVVMSDLQGRLLFASPQTWRLLGLAAKEELVGRGIFDFVVESDRPRLAANMARLIEAGRRTSTEYTALRKDGTTVPTEASSSVIRDDGGPTAVMAVIRDISSRKKVEEALLRERRTLKHMLQASDHERQLIAYDIHDGLAQQLAGAIMQFQIYAHQKDAQPAEAQKAFDGGTSLLRQAHFEARRLISGVRPPILDESGVIAAIAHLVHDPLYEQGPKIDFRSRVTFTRLAPVMENVIYRIVQEGLTNARKHSHSPKILVSLRQRGDRLRIEIRDWGTGFDTRTIRPDAFGIEGIRERARLLGGKCSLKSQPGHGATLNVELPVVERDAES